MNQQENELTYTHVDEAEAPGETIRKAWTQEELADLKRVLENNPDDTNAAIQIHARNYARKPETVFSKAHNMRHLAKKKKEKKKLAKVPSKRTIVRKKNIQVPYTHQEEVEILETLRDTTSRKKDLKMLSKKLGRNEASIASKYHVLKYHGYKAVPTSVPRELDAKVRNAIMNSTPVAHPMSTKVKVDVDDSGVTITYNPEMFNFSFQEGLIKVIRK